MASHLLPAQPAPILLSPGRCALIMIDMQRDFISKGGYGDLQCNSETVFDKVASNIEPCKEALWAARRLGMTVIHTREGHNPDLLDLAPSKRLRQRTARPQNHPFVIGERGPMGKLLVRGEFGHEIIDELKPKPTEIVIDKPGKGSFYNTSLYWTLTSLGITHLLLCGVTTECCVATTFREANDRGFDCCVLADCTNGFNEDIVKQTINVSCAYDGLLGSVSFGKDLVILANQNSPGELQPDTWSVHNSPLDGVRYQSFDGHVNKLCKEKGAIYSTDAQFKLIVDDGFQGFDMGSVQFTASNGMVSLLGADCPSFSSVAILSESVAKVRTVFTVIGGYIAVDPYSRDPNEYFQYPVDYRGVIEGGFAYSSFDDLKLHNGRSVDFNFTVVSQLMDFIQVGASSFTMELASQKRCPFPSPEKFSKDERKLAFLKKVFNESLRYIDILIFPVNSTLSGFPISLLPRIVGCPCVILKGNLIIAKRGYDGRLLDICEVLQTQKGFQDSI